MRLRGDTGKHGKPCLFRLYDRCIIYDIIKDIISKEGMEWGSKEFVKIYCSMCVKALYARAHYERAQAMKVVNTL